jgi:uncharacterized membrane protein YbaN (DUF454 family)
MLRTLRIVIGALFTLVGVVFAILPGSILFLLSGLVLLSMEFPKMRKALGHCQKAMQTSARKLDRYLLKRKLSR